MSKKDKDEKVEQLKKEVYQIDALLRTENDPSQTIKRVEGIIEDLIGGNDSQVEYLLNDMLPRFVTTLLKKGDFADDDAISNTNRLFQLVLQLFLSYIKSDFLELSETASKIFTPNSIFYMKNTNTDDEDDEDEELPDPIIYSNEVSSYLNQNVKYFVSVGGLDTIMERMKDKVSLSVLKNLVKIVAKLRDFLETKYLTSYIEELHLVVYSRILNLSDDELKIEDKRRITDLTSFVENLLKLIKPQQASEISEKFQLQVVLKLFSCPYLDKKVAALNDLRDMISIVYKKHEYATNKQGPAPTQWITSKHLVDWILEHKIVELSFGKGIHTEIVRRAIDMVKYLAFYSHLEKSHLDLIWESMQGKHESIKHAIQQAISDLSNVLSYEDLDYLFEKIFKVEYSEYDNQMLIMVRQCTIDVVRHVMMHNNGKHKRWHGFEILWDLLQDKTVCDPEIPARSLNIFYELMNWPLCHVMRVPYMEKCIQNLKEFNSVSNSLKLLARILGTYPDKRTKKEDSIPTVIEWLDSEYNLLNLFFATLLHLKQQAKLAVTDNINQFIIGREPYLTQIRERLDFLDYILSWSDLMLTSQQIDLLWDYIILQAQSAEERDAGFQWLENARGSQKLSAPFNDEITDYIFNDKLSTLDMSQLSASGFSFFEFYFRYENWKLDKFQQDPNSTNPLNNYIVLSFDLVGLNYLWKIALESVNNTVGQQAILFLNNLHKNLSRELIPLVTQEREQFVSTCMAYLAAASQDFEKNTLIVERCLIILRTFLDEFEIKIGARSSGNQGNPMKLKINVVGGSPPFEVDCFTNDTILSLRQKVSDKISHPANLIRFITSGREVTADNNTISQERIAHNQVLYVAKRMGMPAGLEPKKPSITTLSPTEIHDESALPSSILSQQKYFDQLFSLLKYEKVAQNVWDLVMLLPVNKKMYQDIFHNTTVWSSLLDTSSKFKLLYSLQIVDSLLTSQSEDSEKVKVEKEEWRRGFLESGGMEYIVDVLLKHSFFENKMKGDKSKVCLSLLLKILNNFVIVKDESGVFLDSVLFSRISQPQHLILRLLEIIWFASTSEPPFFKTDILGKPEQSDISIVNNSMDLIVAASTQQDTDILSSIFSHSAFDTWLSTLLLNCGEAKIRDCIANGMLTIVKSNSTLIEGVSPLVFLTEKLLGYLPGIEPTLSTCEEYFVLVSKLVAEQTTQYVHLLDKLCQMIKQHPTVEARGKMTEDTVLIGLVNLTRTLAAKNPEMKTEIGHHTKGGLVQEIFWKLLFDIPTAENHDPLAPPKCKSLKSRKMAFRLLSELARDSPDNFQELSTLLISQHNHEDKRTSWHYLPSSYSKSNTGYVGLKNLGATCYMNSLMQQLYMVPALRYGLLSAPVEKIIEGELEKIAENEREQKRPQVLQENLLHQMQILLANLQESEKKYFDTKDFVKTYKYDGQPVDPLVQMDADEFFNMLFDRLDTLLKGTDQENLLKEYFGGNLCNQIISKECGHVSEREEKFFTISLETKNKKNISESLDLYVEGELLEGDNKYFCSQCEKKVDAKKRICVGELPDNLIFHLKRFDFDLELLKRAKVYDYCEFPTTLNMMNYTKEGLGKKEGATSEIKENSYYDYELTGILVHTGSADSGHYYSFIRKREAPGTSERKWYHFNDTDVEPFDPKDIGKNCFGGVESTLQWDPVQNKQVQRFSHKMYSAYMLFYERVKPLHTNQSLSIQEESKVVPKDIFQNIWRENMSFLSDKNIFDTDYFSFIWSIVSQTKIPDHVITPDSYNPSAYDPIKMTIELATRFVFITLVHSKEKPNMKEYISLLKSLYSLHIPACIWLLRNLELQTLRQIMLFCTSNESRDMLVNLLIHVVLTLIPYDRHNYDVVDMDVMEVMCPWALLINKVEDKNKNPLAPEKSGVSKSSVILFIESLLSLLREANPHWQHYGQYFSVFREFANAGIEEKRYLLSRNVVSQFIDFYLADESPYANKFSYKRNKMGDKFTSPSLQNMLECISLLVISSDSNPRNTPENALTMSQQDKDLLQNEIFYARTLRENIHPQSTSMICNHLAFESEEFSKKILDICTEGINISGHDAFKPYFDVMSPLFSIQDSLEKTRIEYGLDKYMIVVDENSKYSNATYFSIKYLIDTASINRSVNDWLYIHKPRWIVHYLLSSGALQVREITSQLITCLIPGLPMIYSERKEQEQEDISKEKLHDVYEYLLKLLPVTRQYWKIDVETGKMEADMNSYKLVQYFKLLKYLTLGPAEAALFGGHFMAFWNLFSSGDSLQYPCDENKKELTSYWNLCCVTYPDNIQLFIDLENKAWTRLLDHFNSLSERYIKYNQTSLPSFYNLLKQFCNANTKFLHHVCGHTNFDWATRYLFLESEMYADAGQAVFEIVKMGSTSVHNYSTKVIALVLQIEKMNSNYMNMLRCLDYVIRTVEESAVFARYRGYDQIYRMLCSRVEKEVDYDKMATVAELALSVVNKSIAWWFPDQVPDIPIEKINSFRTQVLSIWDSTARVNYVQIFLALTKKFPTRENLCNGSYQLITSLCSVDTFTLTSTLRYLWEFVSGGNISVTDSFLNFIRKVLQKGLETCEDKAILNAIVEITASIAKSNPFIDFLGTLWENPKTQDMVKNSTSTAQFVKSVLLLEFSQLEDIQLENFFTKAIPSIKPCLNEDTKTSISTGQMDYLKQSVHSIKNCVDMKDYGGLENSLISAIQVLKAINVYAQDQPDKRKEAVGIVAEVISCDQLKVLDRFEELEKLFKNLTL